MKSLERFKNTVIIYVADIRPDRITTCQSERKSVVSRRPSVIYEDVWGSGHIDPRFLDLGTSWR
jgi:hypothetical protein